MLPETLTEDERVALTQLATQLAGGAEAGVRLLAISVVRPADRDERVDAGDYPYESSRQQLVSTFLSRRGSGSGPNRHERIQHAVAVLSRVEALGPESIARATGLSAARVATALETAPVDGEMSPTAPDLRTPDRVHLEQEIRRQARRQRSRRRRMALLAGVSILLLAAAAIVPAVVIPRLPRQPHDPDTWVMVHTIELEEGWSVIAQAISPTSEMTVLATSDDRPSPKVCQVALYAPRLGRLDLGFDPDHAPGEPFRLDGRPATFAQDPAGPEGATVFWLYSDEAWATLTCRDSPATERADLVGLARNITFEPQQVRVPVRLPSLPDGYEIDWVSTWREQPTIVVSTGGQESWNVVISALRASESAGETESVQINGRAAVYDTQERSLCLQTANAGSLCLSAQWNGFREPDELADPRDILLATAESLELAPDLSDRGTWFDARAAFP